jgi:hypothetical protein
VSADFLQVAQGARGVDDPTNHERPKCLRKSASLNISTFIALATYDYTNLYELGPLLDVATTRLRFEGSEVK